jgi:hypothetical protein
MPVDELVKEMAKDKDLTPIQLLYLAFSFIEDTANLAAFDEWIEETGKEDFLTFD